MELTVLGETGDPAELFRLDTCDDEPLLSYVGRANVEMLGMPDPTVYRGVDCSRRNWRSSRTFPS